MNPKSLLNDVIGTIPPSGIRKFFDLASSMEGVISLGVGEPDFDTPWQCFYHFRTSNHRKS